MENLGLVLGIVISFLTIIGILIKVVVDYTKLKEDTAANKKAIMDVLNSCEKEDKDIRIDYSKDIKNVEDNVSKEIQNIRSDMKEEKEYTHQSFVKLTNDQQKIAEALQGVTGVLQTFQTSIDTRLSSLERKIDSITVLKVNKDA